MKRILTAAILLTSVLAGSQVFARSAFAGDAQHYYQVVWNDVQKPWRANSDINAAVTQDSDACESVVGEQHGGPSGAMVRCMTAKHWKLSHVVRMHSPPGVEPEEESTPIPGIPDRRPDDVFPDSPVPVDVGTVTPGQ
jgi:hypothetical protein